MVSLGEGGGVPATPGDGGVPRAAAVMALWCRAEDHKVQVA
jgi:hypothetical protein